MNKIGIFFVKFSFCFMLAIFLLETVKRLVLHTDKYTFYRILIIFGIVISCVMPIVLIINDIKNNQERIPILSVLLKVSNYFIKL